MWQVKLLTAGGFNLAASAHQSSHELRNSKSSCLFLHLSLIKTGSSDNKSTRGVLSASCRSFAFMMVLAGSFIVCLPGASSSCPRVPFPFEVKSKSCSALLRAQLGITNADIMIKIKPACSLLQEVVTPWERSLPLLPVLLMGMICLMSPGSSDRGLPAEGCWIRMF